MKQHRFFPGVLCPFPATIIPPMHRTRDSFICHRPYAILATDSFIRHNTSLFLEHIPSTHCIKRSESLTNTPTPIQRYVHFGQSKMGQVASAVPNEGGAHSSSYSRPPEKFTEIKQTKRQANSPASPDDRGGCGKNYRGQAARKGARDPIMFHMFLSFSVVSDVISY